MLDQASGSGTSSVVAVTILVEDTEPELDRLEGCTCPLRSGRRSSKSQINFRDPVDAHGEARDVQAHGMPPVPGQHAHPNGLQ
nr:unnamed protein product [Digitaria exilis]